METKLGVNVDRLWKLLDSVAAELPESRKAQGYSELARRLGVNKAQLHGVLNGKLNAGNLFLGRLRSYCKENGLAFDEFVS